MAPQHCRTMIPFSIVLCVPEETFILWMNTKYSQKYSSKPELCNTHKCPYDTTTFLYHLPILDYVLVPEEPWILGINPNKSLRVLCHFFIFHLAKMETNIGRIAKVIDIKRSDDESRTTCQDKPTDSSIMTINSSWMESIIRSPF